MKSLFQISFLVLLMLSDNPAWAEAKPLGRLFFSPEQRAAMDQLQHMDGQSPSEQKKHFTLNGALHRKHGRSIYWGNGQRLPEDASLPRKILVGDTLNGNTGQTESILQGGNITIKPGEGQR